MFPPQTDKAEAIALLRDTMASLRWTFWEQNGVFSRADLDVGAERQKLLLALEEYPTLDWAYEQSCILRHEAKTACKGRPPRWGRAACLHLYQSQTETKYSITNRQVTLRSLTAFSLIASRLENVGGFHPPNP